MIAGGSSYLLAKKTFERDQEKEKIRRNKELLETVAQHVEVFTSQSLVYWVWVGDSIRVLNGTKKLGVDKEKLDVVKKEHFDTFQEMTSAEAKLLLLGYKSAAEKLRNYGDVVVSMRKRFSSSPRDVTEDEIYEWRAKMMSSRAIFFDELSSIYKQ